MTLMLISNGFRCLYAPLILAAVLALANCVEMDGAAPIPAASAAKDADSYSSREASHEHEDTSNIYEGSSTPGDTSSTTQPQASNGDSSVGPSPNGAVGARHEAITPAFTSRSSFAPHSGANRGFAGSGRAFGNFGFGSTMGVGQVFAPMVSARIQIVYRGDRHRSRGPQAFFVLMRGEKARNLEACYAVIDTFGMPATRFPSPRANIVPVYWLDARMQDKAGNVRFACGDGLENYDYGKADAAVANLSKRKLMPAHVRGPILLAFRNAGTLAYALDLSAMSATDLKDFFVKWHDDLLGDPQFWDGKTLQAELVRRRERAADSTSGQPLLIMPRGNLYGSAR
jgi:hypothetical protein